MAELMIVVAVISLLVGIGFFSLARTVRRTRLKSSVMELKSDLLYLRTQAYAKSEERGIHRANSETYTFVKIVFDSATGDYDTSLYNPHKLPRGISFGGIYPTDMPIGGIDSTVLPVSGFYGVKGASGKADDYVVFSTIGTLKNYDSQYIYIHSKLINEMWGLKVDKFGRVTTYKFEEGGWREIK